MRATARTSRRSRSAIPRVLKAMQYVIEHLEERRLLSAIASFSDFDSTTASGWSNTTTSTTPKGNNRFLGPFGDTTGNPITLGSV